MGLYLCIFDGDEDVDGIDVGAYSDWNTFIRAIIAHMENGLRGMGAPVLTLHGDSDGEWSPAECAQLERTLDDIERIFSRSPPEPPQEGWQAKDAKRQGLRFTNLADCVFDVDGQNLITRLRDLAKLAQKLDRPILFQ
jgi:hypothetical protein